MESKRSLTSEEISTIVAGIDPIGVEEMEMLKKLPLGKRWLTTHSKSEAIRADLRNKLMEDFPELSLPEINVKVLRSLTPVRMGKNYTDLPIMAGFANRHGINPCLSLMEAPGRTSEAASADFHTEAGL